MSASSNDQFRIDEIRALFWNEFSPLTDRFRFMCLNLERAHDSSFEKPAYPGVYVFWKNDKVYKIGRSLDNARKRALEHIEANTGGEIRALDGDPDTRLLLFLVDRKEDEVTDDLHWVMALEDYFEQVLKPKVPSDRRG